MTQDPSHQLAFQKVLDDFKKGLSKKEKDEFKDTSLQDLQQSIGELQTAQNGKRRSQFLDRIGPFLEAMKQWGQVVEVFCNSNEIVAFVWVSYCWLICRCAVVLTSRRGQSSLFCWYSPMTAIHGS